MNKLKLTGCLPEFHVSISEEHGRDLIKTQMAGANATPIEDSRT